MRISPRGLDFLKESEFLKTVAYLDIAGVWTIGYGHTSNAGEPKVKPGMIITEQEADFILAKDLEPIEKIINSKVKVKLTQSQYDALVSFIFNIGIPEFLKSTLLKELNKGRYENIPFQIQRWNKITDPKTGKKVESKGLKNRRVKEAALWVDDAWQNDETPNRERNIVKPETTPIITKENISWATGIGGTGLTALGAADGAGPVQYALAAMMVIGFTVALYYFLSRRQK